MPVIGLTFVTFKTYNNEQQRQQHRVKKFRGFCQCHRVRNRAGASPAHQCRQCADAVPLLEDGQLHIVPSEPARLGRQGHQETGASDTVQLSRKERIFGTQPYLYVPIRKVVSIERTTMFY